MTHSNPNSKPRLVTVPDFRKYHEPDAFKSDQAIYTAARNVPGFPAVKCGRKLFIDVGKWKEFIDRGGAALAGGWRREAK
jgi:hypothetical protein